MTRMSIRSGRALLHAEVGGSRGGRTIVFLHAAVADSRMWLQSMAQLESTATMVAYDRRGFGKTQYETEDYSSIADLTAVLDSLAAGKRAILVGCSQGGRIALDAAIEHPDRVGGLILVAPNVPGAPEAAYSQEIQELLALQARLQKLGDITQLNSLKARLWLDGPSADEGRVTGEPRNLLLEMNSIALTAPTAGTDLDISRVAPAFHRLGQIDVPTLMIWGDLDFPHICARCRLVAEMIRTCHSLELSGTAHLPSLDRPAAVSLALQHFLAQLQLGDA